MCPELGTRFPPLLWVARKDFSKPLCILYKKYRRCLKFGLRGGPVEPPSQPSEVATIHLLHMRKPGCREVKGLGHIAEPELTGARGCVVVLTLWGPGFLRSSFPPPDPGVLEAATGLVADVHSAQARFGVLNTAGTQRPPL